MPPGMASRLGGNDIPFPYGPGDPGMVFSNLIEVVASQAIEPRVSHMGTPGLGILISECHYHDGSTHIGPFGMTLLILKNGHIRLL